MKRIVLFYTLTWCCSFFDAVGQLADVNQSKPRSAKVVTMPVTTTKPFEADTALRAPTRDADLQKTVYFIDSSPGNEPTVFQTIFGYVKELIGPLVALLGILVAIPILRKKIVENHVTSALTKIQESNNKIQKKCYQLIDAYIPLTYDSKFLKRSEVQDVCNDVKALFYDSLDGSADVVSFLSYLKDTLQGMLKHFEEDITINNRGFYGVIVDVLQTTVFYCSQVVPLPRSTATETTHLIIKKLKKYVHHAEFVRYRHFNQGVIEDPHSAHFTIFYSKLNQANISIMLRSAAQFYSSTAPIRKLLFLHQLYAPVRIEASFESPLEVDGKLRAILIGFKRSTTFDLIGQTRTNIVELTYANLNDVFRFVQGLKFEKVKRDFIDTGFPDLKFEMSKASKMAISGFEMFTITFEEEYLKEQFKLRGNGWMKRRKLNQWLTDKTF